MSRPLSGFTLGDTEYPFLQKPYRGQAQLDSHLSLGTLFDSLFDTSILESWIPTYNIPSAHIVAPIPPDLTKREWFTSFFLFFTTYSNKPFPQEKCWEDGNYISPSGLECIYVLSVIGTGRNVAVS
ncbi:hypothetical protein NW756_001112 [Fusarium oxysporum]|nr:hypothetical protein NW753_005382 [Fusarium oxysporum]KAJ4063594.1 hypothetical protein NW763_003867 [Fusarium oxysporum]KAJ4105342.1 hypothetical protein NW756_001112 [Fusarium oxysporum]